MEMKKYKLSEIATVEISGVDKKRKENETPVKLCNFTDVYHNWAITKDMEDSFMDATATDKEIDTFVLKKGQVAFTKDSETRDDIGIPTYIADDFDNVILGYHTALITPDKTKLSGKYLNAFMNSNFIKKYFENNASGSGQRYTLSNDTLNSIPIIIPNLTKQKVVGNFFSNIDKKIALNKKINAKLEAMAKRLYDYWFVQFDFPNSDGKPYKSSGGKMVWNEVLKRKIPEGWEVKRLGEVCDFRNGINYEKNNSGDKIYKIVNVRNITATTFFLNQNDFDEICLQSKIADNYLIPEISILIARSGSPGATRVIMNVKNNVIFCGFIICMEKFTPKYKFYFTYFLKKLENTSATKTGGSILQNVSQDTLKRLSVIIPSKEMIDEFNEKILPIFNYQLTIQKEIQKLTSMRDRLLPLLMNGQVEIK